jgi:hypothetical protein
MAQRAQQQADFDIENVVERASEIGEQVQTGITQIAREARSRLKRLDINETTIPDAFGKVPKFISPGVHKWLDVATTAYFAVLGTVFAFRGHGRAATAAFVNAGMVGGVSALTDYDGDENKPINFKLHGTLDAVQATTAAIAPLLHGFADEPESAYFYGQAANELTVIATTDWDAGMPRRSRRRAA